MRLRTPLLALLLLAASGVAAWPTQAPGESPTLTRLRALSGVQAPPSIFPDGTPDLERWRALEPQLHLLGEDFCDCICVPGPEICDGLDNDCDDVVDNDLTDTNVACSAGVGECLSFGVRTCNAGVLECDAVPALPQAEMCDGLDNDCDGTTDNDPADEGEICATGLPGVCDPGLTVCESGVLECSATAVDAEVCDGQDNDCDGEIDEACTAFQMESGTATADGLYLLVPFVKTYSDPIVVATVQYDNNTKPVVGRVSNVSSTGFELRLQNPSGGAVQADNVSYWVVERGVWNVDGIRLEADRYLSTRTSRKNAWAAEPRTYGQSYVQPVVVGQVMTENDSRWSVFFARGTARNQPPSASALNLGKHVGEDPVHQRANETIGYIVIEAVHATSFGGAEFEAALGPDIVQGIPNGPPYVYTYNNPFGTAPTVTVASLAGMDGGDGGWAQVHGPTMATTTQLNLSADEDQLGDTERSKGTEQVGFVSFSGPAIFPGQPDCSLDADCDDGLFCNGLESCDSNQVCRPGGNPCPGQLCDESDGCIAGVTPKMESVIVPGTGEFPIQVDLVNAYISPVIACTPVYSANSVPVVVRISDVTSTSFRLTLQNPGDLTGVTYDTTSCLIVEEGSWTMDGHPVEAQKFTSTTTDNDPNWLGTARSLTHGFTNPVVLGQVMSTNDPQWSVYWQQGTARTEPPGATALRSGKTVCEDTDVVRNDETIGLIVFEQSNGAIAGIPFEAALGPDTVLGVGNNPPFDYTFNVEFTTPPTDVIATQAGMDGKDGSWAYLFGSSFSTTTTLSLAVDEDQIENAERAHSSEQVGYVAFERRVIFPLTGCTSDAECNDGNVCNGVETCVPGMGGGGESACQSGLPLACDDGVGCTRDECDPSDGCIYSPDDANCDNGLFCDGVETCDEVSDCQSGNPVDCGAFTCDEIADTCLGDGPVARMEWGTLFSVGGDDLPGKNLDKGGLPPRGSRVALTNTYEDPVVVTSIRYANNTVPVVSRVTNVTANSFDVFLQNPSGNAIETEAVDFIVVERGTWVIDGVAIEAQKYLSTKTAHDTGWNQFDTQTYGQTYTSPVVLGQVMSANNSDFSVFWSRGPTRTVPPTSSVLHTGKTVAEDPDIIRANETIGFIVIEAGHGFIGGVEYEARVSTDTVQAVANEPPYFDAFATSFPGPPAVAVATQTAMDGGNGGWMYTFGATPNSATAISLAGDEDQLMDPERSRATEQAAYVVFQTAGVVPVPVDTETTITLGDNDFAEVPLPFSFPFCGTSYDSVFVGSNGHLSFGEGASLPLDVIPNFLQDLPVIAGLAIDLDPSTGGQIVSEEPTAGEFEIRFIDVPEAASGSGSNTFTFLLRNDGSYSVSYGTVSAADGLAGRSPGSVPDPGETDLTSAGPALLAFRTVYESFSGDNDLSGAMTEWGTCPDFELAKPGLCYGSTGENDDGRFIVIDPATGVGTLLGDLETSAMPALAINSRGEIFGAAADGEIYRIDAATGRDEEIADLTQDADCDAIAFDENDVLYGIDDSTRELRIIDPTTGSTTVVGSSPTGTGDEMKGMAFDRTTGILYGSTGGRLDRVEIPDAIYTINTATGGGTLLGTTGLIDTYGAATPDLCNIGNVIYGVKGGGQNPNFLITIDKITGAGTVIGPVGFEAVGGLAARPE